MKHAAFISLTAAASLGACRDATAPERTAQLVALPPEATVAPATDSSTVWASLALVDAATRLLSGLDDSKVRSDLKRALHALSAKLGDRNEKETARGFYDAALRALRHLREVSDVATVPDLDAIALALDAAVSALDARDVAFRFVDVTVANADFRFSK